MTTSREIRLKSRPVGTPTADNFEMATVDLADPAAGEVQVRNLWMTVDPYMRGRMSDAKSYAAPFELGMAMQGGAVGEVVASNDPGFKAGDMVLSQRGWREGFTAPVAAVQKLPAGDLPPQAYLGVAGMPGMTAWSGLLHVANLKDGDVVFVSGAAGAVGSMVCQIAKAKGHTVIGSAGGDRKTEFLRRIGVDHVIDYKAVPKLTRALHEAAPDGIDVYFDNVGGEHLEAALSCARFRARFALCGMISVYNNTEATPGPRNLQLAIGRNIRLEGFIVTHFYHLQDQFMADLAGWVREGKITWEETVFEGIDRAPEAFLGLFRGDNLGKMLVKLA